VLFGVLSAGAGVGLMLDKNEHRRVMARLRSPACGFCLTSDSTTQLWTFALDELPNELSAPAGSAVALCKIFGLPFARLRAALPDCWFTAATMSSALGRRHSFSCAGMDGASSLHAELLQRGAASKASPRASSPRACFMPVAEADKADAPDDAALASLQHFVGTALVLAFMQVCQLAPVDEIAAHRARAVVHFADVLTPAGWGFAKT
jgi:hypothetical protein